LFCFGFWFTRRCFIASDSFYQLWAEQLGLGFGLKAGLLCPQLVKRVACYETTPRKPEAETKQSIISQ
jgi:hypothetical protein